MNEVISVCTVTIKMEEKTKKARSANFSKNDIDIISSLVVKYSAIIEQKKSDALSWKEKMQAWNNLTSEFNGLINGLPRTTISLKTKYETIKKEIRKKVAANKQEIFKTGGGVPKIVPLSKSEQMIYSIIRPSVDGLPSRYDDDDDDIPDIPDIEEDIPIKEDEIILVEYVEDNPENKENDNGEDTETDNAKHKENDTKDKENETCLSPLSAQIGKKRKAQKWNPESIKRPISSELNATRNKNLKTKLQAAQRVNVLADTKNKLLQLQSTYWENEVQFQVKEQELKLKKATEEIKNTELEVEIKQIEKRIKEETLKQILNRSVF